MKILTVIIQAHGCPSIIQFSQNHRVNLTSLGIFETLAQKLKQNANLSLISCSTGQGTDNIAQRISTLCPTATIFCPKENYMVADYSSFNICDDDGSCSFINGNFITGLFKKRENTTRIYQNGQVMEAIDAAY